MIQKTQFGSSKIQLWLFFFALNETCVYLRPQQKVWIESCHSSFVHNLGAVARKEFAILVNRIFPTLLAESTKPWFHLPFSGLAGRGRGSWRKQDLRLITSKIVMIKTQLGDYALMPPKLILFVLSCKKTKKRSNSQSTVFQSDGVSAV